MIEMRCKACNKPMSREEISSSKPDGSPEDLCNVCLWASGVGYANILDQISDRQSHVNDEEDEWTL